MFSLIVNSLLILTLCLLILEDFNLREISWPLIVLIFVLLGIKNWNTEDLTPLLSNILFNFLFIIIQVISILLYVRISKGWKVKVIDHYLGWGDILLLIALAPAFVPFHFILFVLITLLATLVLYSSFRLLNIKHKKEIPLAGIFSAFFILHLLFHPFYTDF